MLTCKKCNTEKSSDEFYDSNKSKCKECVKRDVRANRKMKIDYYREYDRKRGNRQGLEYVREYRSKNPEKYKAHCAVNNAVRDGKLEKDPCFMCGDEKVEAHHCDYSKPLEVIWLCPSCHKLQHAYESKVEEIRSKDSF